MRDILISFVIPVYNVERYLDECINSIVQQMTDQCECVLIDDGSTDTSGAICDEYRRRDNFIVIHTANGGLSSARNVGVQASRGKYIAFVDSDDRISTGSVSTILKVISNANADIFFLNCEKFDDTGRKENLGDNITPKKLKGKSRLQVLKILATRPKFPGSACTKLYRREFLCSNGLKFEVGRRSEDLSYNRDAFLKAESFDCIDVPYYEYRQNRVGSITFAQKHSKGIYGFVKESIELLCINEKPKDIYCKYAMSFAAYEYVIYLWLEEHPDISFEWILKYGKSRKQRVIYLYNKVFGIKATRKLLQKTKRK